MYLKVKKLNSRFKKIPELPDIGAIADKVNKMSHLFLLIMGDPYVNAEIKKIPREDWEWFGGMLMDYGNESDNEFWEIMLAAANHQERVDVLENLLISLPSMEVSQYV